MKFSARVCSSSALSKGSGLFELNQYIQWSLNTDNVTLLWESPLPTTFYIFPSFLLGILYWGFLHRSVANFLELKTYFWYIDTNSVKVLQFLRIGFFSSGINRKMKLICRVGNTVSMVPENRISGSLCGRNKSTMVVLKAAISKNTSKGVKFLKN